MRYFLFLTFVGLFSCAQGPSSVQLPETGAPFETLSEYHFFEGALKRLSPNDGVFPYDLNSTLFTDYAHKARFVWMPEGRTAQYQEDQVLDFPLETVLIKNFFYFHDERKPSAGRRIIETRLLIHRQSGWKAHSYVWNEAQTEAHLDLVGDIIPVDWTNAAGEAQHANYIIPNRNQCKGCHALDEKLMPIGPKGRNLNREFVYSDTTANQLNYMNTLGMINGFDPQGVHQKAAVWDDPENHPLHDRAMAYLDINCGHCHNPQGPGGTTGLNLVYGAAIDLNLGVNKPPVAAGRATGGHSVSILKGDPDQSIMVHRMASDEPGVMMPELGRTLVHEEGVTLIREWIAAMK